MDQKMHTLYIRADANETIGTGHLMRCLSIAQAMRRAGDDAIFLVADSQTESIVKEWGFSVVCLYSEWNDLEQELDRFVDLIQEKNMSLLLIDSYYVTPHYLKTLGQYTKLVYIDDLDAFSYSVDLLIQYAIYSKKREGRTYPDILEGCAYAPLKHQFYGLPKRVISEQVKRILVLTGGADQYHVAVKLAKYVADATEYQQIRFDVVCGRYNRDQEELCRLADGSKQIFVHFNAANMEELMLGADIAVTAGGTTLYELCACGTPAVCYVLADNQIQNAQTFAEQGFMLYGGDVREEGWLLKIVEQLELLRKDAILREKMAEAMQCLVDGKGSDRIVEAMRRLLVKSRNNR